MRKRQDELRNLLLIRPEASPAMRLKQVARQAVSTQDRTESMGKKHPHQQKEEKKAKNFNLPVLKYHAQELHDLLTQKPSHPLCTAMCAKLRILLSLKSMKETEARPPIDDM